MELLEHSPRTLSSIRCIGGTQGAGATRPDQRTHAADTTHGRQKRTHKGRHWRHTGAAHGRAQAGDGTGASIVGGPHTSHPERWGGPAQRDGPRPRGTRPMERSPSTSLSLSGLEEWFRDTVSSPRIRRERDIGTYLARAPVGRGPRGVPLGGTWAGRAGRGAVLVRPHERGFAGTHTHRAPRDAPPIRHPRPPLRACNPPPADPVGACQWFPAAILGTSHAGRAHTDTHAYTADAYGSAPVATDAHTGTYTRPRPLMPTDALPCARVRGRQCTPANAGTRTHMGIPSRKYAHIGTHPRNAAHGFESPPSPHPFPPTPKYSCQFHPRLP